MPLNRRGYFSTACSSRLLRLLFTPLSTFCSDGSTIASDACDRTAGPDRVGNADDTQSMAPSDDAQDPAPGPSNVPALINDYRAQRDAWRAQAGGLARMREEVLAAADREARDIVTAARVDVRQTLVKARRDLLVLTAQVQAATDTSEQSGPGHHAGDADYAVPAQADDLRGARDVFALARHDVRGVLNDARPDLEALSSEAGALRSSLQWQPPALFRAPSRVIPPRLELPATAELPGEWPRDPIAAPRSLRAFVLAFVVVGVAVLIATGWWLRRPTSGDDASPQQTVEPVAGPLASQPAVSAIDALPPAARIEKPTALSVTVEARRLAWIRATVDGRVVSARLFEAGETQQITDARDVSIRAGDAGAVFVSVNGGEASALGRDGQVVTRRFVFEEAGEPVGSSSPQSIGGIGDIPSADVTREEPTPPPLPASSSPNARSQAGALGVNTSRAPLAIDTVPPVIAPQPLDTVPPLIAPQPPPPKAAAGALSLQEEFVRAAGQWLDAYYRRDQNAMAAFSDAQVSVFDERTENERLPQGLAGARRSLEDVNVQVFGESAILTARMTERWENIAVARMATADSFVSQIWTRRAGTWRLSDVRIVSASTLNRTFR